MCTIENMIHRQKSQLDLKNEAIAELMQRAGHQVSGSQIQKIFSGESGITVDKIGAFLQALGLRVIGTDDKVMPHAEYQALAVFARKALGDMVDK